MAKAGAVLLMLVLTCCSGTTSARGGSPSTPGPSVSTFGNDRPSPSRCHSQLPPDQDPALTDGDKYHVAFENERVRVFRYQGTPGARTHAHHHPGFVLYALSAFRRRLVFPDGTAKERGFHPGDVIWMPEQTHIGENTGSTDTDVVIVEMKCR